MPYPRGRAGAEFVWVLISPYVTAVWTARKCVPQPVWSWWEAWL